MTDKDTQHEWNQPADRSLQKDQNQEWKDEKKSSNRKTIVRKAKLIGKIILGCKLKKGLWNRCFGPCFYDQKSQQFSDLFF